MTADEKQRAAGFLDLAGDFLMYGFRSTQKEYHFEDDAQSGVLCGVLCGAQSPVGEKKAPSPAGEEDTIARIAAEIRACNNCPLAATRTNAAPGEGVTRPLVLVIGEGPGAEEDAQGRPFVGRAGQLLDKMLSSIDLSRNSNCFIANVVKCRPPGNRDPQPEETQACAHFLKRQILLLNPEFILVAGRVAAQTLLDTTEPVAKLRGKFTSLTVGEKKIPLLVTYHPAFLLRSEEFKRPAWEDLKLLRSRIENSKKENSSGVN